MVSISLFNPGNAILRTKHYRSVNIFFRVLIKLNYLNIAGIIITEHLGAELDAAHAPRTCTNINIRFFHYAYFFELIINQGGVAREDFFSFRINLVNYLVDLVLLPALFALHANFSANP